MTAVAEERSGVRVQHGDKFLGVWFGMGGRRKCSGGAPDLFLLSCVILPSLVSASKFPSCFKPDFFQKCVSDGGGSSLRIRPAAARRPIKVPYLCGKGSFISLSSPFLHTLHPSLTLFPLFSITFLVPN